MPGWASSSSVVDWTLVVGAGPERVLWATKGGAKRRGRAGSEALGIWSTNAPSVVGNDGQRRVPAPKAQHSRSHADQGAA
jgi:hypothetical protein